MLLSSDDDAEIDVSGGGGGGRQPIQSGRLGIDLDECEITIGVATDQQFDKYTWWGISGVKDVVSWRTFIAEAQGLDLNVRTRVITNASGDTKASVQQSLSSVNTGCNFDPGCIWEWITRAAVFFVKSNAFMKLVSQTVLALSDIDVVTGFASYVQYYNSGNYMYLVANAIMWFTYVGGGKAVT
jgi:hypothetical protein